MRKFGQKSNALKQGTNANKNYAYIEENVKAKDPDAEIVEDLPKTFRELFEFASAPQRATLVKPMLNPARIPIQLFGQALDEEMQADSKSKDTENYPIPTQ